MRRSSTARTTSDARVLFVGAYSYALEVYDYLSAEVETEIVTAEPGQPGWQNIDGPAWLGRPVDLIVVAGWRHIIPASVLSFAPAVGFHSAKLPEYPGRAPVPWALLRGDTETWNTLFYLDEGIDTGDIVAERRIPILSTDTPETLYREMGQTAVDMLRVHLPGLLAGSAPRRPQDMSRRGPLTTADGWDRWTSSLR